MAQSAGPQPQGGPEGSIEIGGPQNTVPIDYTLTGLAADRGPIVIGVVSVLWALTIISISLRVTSRYIARCKWWWDDYLAVTAWAFYSIIAASTIYSVSPAVGGAQHYWMITFSQLKEFLQMQSLQFTMYPLSMGAAKCSVIAFYIRVFGIQRRFRWWCFFLLGLVISWSISVCLVTIFMCLPVGSAWDITIPGRTCIDQQSFFNIEAILDAILNFLTLISPLYPIWKLKLSTRRKIAISAVLLMGAGELIFTIIRIVIWYDLQFPDFPWDFYPVYIWTNVQESVGIVCICLPALGPLLKYRSKNATILSKHSEVGNSSKPIPMGRSTFGESVLDQRIDDEVPTKKAMKKSGNPVAISSYSKEGDEVSL